ncbi:enoyl-CoA hydratase/isomerase family protein, partial [Streptococcus mutans]|nr:enoyl-CoA hydratase/isomerase family protein [Streptococcus mutans]
MSVATDTLNGDDAAKVLVLIGAGDRAFCAGGDLKEMAQNALRVPPKDFAPPFRPNTHLQARKTPL